jgi:hypothetical protein
LGIVRKVQFLNTTNLPNSGLALDSCFTTSGRSPRMRASRKRRIFSNRGVPQTQPGLSSATQRFRHSGEGFLQSHMMGSCSLSKSLNIAAYPAVVDDSSRAIVAEIRMTNVRIRMRFICSYLHHSSNYPATYEKPHRGNCESLILHVFVNSRKLWLQ